MAESKITITNRLQREGRWALCTLWMDDKRRELRAAGMTRRASNDEVWRLLGIEFPPLPLLDPIPASIAPNDKPEFCEVAASGVASNQHKLLAEILGADLDSWVEEYDLAFPPFAFADLQSRIAKTVVRFIDNSGRSRKLPCLIAAEVEPL